MSAHNRGWSGRVCIRVPGLAGRSRRQFPCRWGRPLLAISQVSQAWIAIDENCAQPDPSSATALPGADG